LPGFATLHEPRYAFPQVFSTQKEPSESSFGFLQEIRIAVVLSFRRPLTPCGINYMYGVDGDF